MYWSMCRKQPAQSLLAIVWLLYSMAAMSSWFDEGSYLRIIPLHLEKNFSIRFKNREYGERRSSMLLLYEKACLSTTMAEHSMNSSLKFLTKRWCESCCGSPLQSSALNGDVTVAVVLVFTVCAMYAWRAHEMGLRRRHLFQQRVLWHKRNQFWHTHCFYHTVRT